MRILLITENLYTNTAAAQVARGAAKVLGSAGHQVAFLSLEPWPEFESNRWSFPVYLVPRSRRFKYVWDTRQAKLAAETVQHFKPDVAHITMQGNVGCLSWLALSTIQRLGIPLVYAPVGYFPVCMNAYYYRPDHGECRLCEGHNYRWGVRYLCGGKVGSFTQWLAMHLQKKTLRRIDAWLSTCPDFDRALLAYGVHEKRIFRTYHPFDWDRVTNLKVENGSSFVFNAQGRVEKGIHLFPEILAAVSDCDFELYLANVQWRHLHALISSKNRVTVRTDLWWDTGVGAALARSRAAVLPTVNPSFGELAVYEAMALGKPVIAFNVGANPLLIHHQTDGLLANNDDIESLTEFVMLLKNNSKIANELGDSAKQKALSLFDKASVHNIYINTYNEIGKLSKLPQSA